MVSSTMQPFSGKTATPGCRRRSLLHGALLLLACYLPAAAQETRFFRIGTAATGGSFFEVGGLVAGAISGPTDGPPCERGGSCGVPGLVAVAQATPGSVENLRLVNSGQLESGFAQADLAGWAYSGVKMFTGAGPQTKIRAIASLFAEAAHLVVPADSSIRSLHDLAGKRVALGEQGSGTAAVASILLAAAGLRESDVAGRYLRPGPAAEELKAGALDALFLVGGYPVPALRDLAASIPVRLVPIEGDVVAAAEKEFRFYYPTEIPGGTYPGIETATPSLGFSALWVVNEDIGPSLVYEITKSLWREQTTQLLAKLDPIGKLIRLDHALEGLSIPLHPGAARYYRELWMPVDAAPQAAAEPGEAKNP